MKSLFVFFFLVIFSISSFAETIPYYSEGVRLNVFASSGLKLRAFPNQNAEVLDIVRYGDQVLVLNTYDFNEEKADRIDWLDGHWILVEYEGIAGYLFDAYLSGLSFPGSEEEICQDGYSYAYTLGEYFDQHYGQQQMLDSTEGKMIYRLDSGIKIKRVNEQHVYTLEIEIPEMRISELLNLMRSMLPDRDSQIQFENSLVFIEGSDTRINEIRVNLGDSVILKKKSNGNLLVKASGTIGC
ncbi:MAG: SH3 domain-containing protein [Saprospiraceae bacterium]|nr:SH3 domain-containing protein [Saprospiraceae bacterium]